MQKLAISAILIACLSHSGFSQKKIWDETEEEYQESLDRIMDEIYKETEESEQRLTEDSKKPPKRLPTGW